VRFSKVNRGTTEFYDELHNKYMPWERTGPDYEIVEVKRLVDIFVSDVDYTELEQYAEYPL
jgi:hypothetical protein